MTQYMLLPSTLSLYLFSLFFFFNDTATTEIYTLSLHDALPISGHGSRRPGWPDCRTCPARRSEEHTSELQSRSDLVCRLLLEKKKKNITPTEFLYYKSNSPSNTQLSSST